MGSVDGLPLMLGWELMVRIPRLLTFSSWSFRRLVSVARGSSFQGIHVTYHEEKGQLTMDVTTLWLPSGYWRNSGVPLWSQTHLLQQRIPRFGLKVRICSVRMTAQVNQYWSCHTVAPFLLCWPFSQSASKSFWIKCQFFFRKTIWYQEQEEVCTIVYAPLTILSWALTHLVPIPVGFSGDVTGEYLKDTFLTSQFFSPHLQKLLPGRLALQIEEVIVLQFPKSWRGGVTPVREEDTDLKSPRKMSWFGDAGRQPTSKRSTLQNSPRHQKSQHLGAIHLPSLKSKQRGTTLLGSHLECAQVTRLSHHSSALLQVTAYHRPLGKSSHSWVR